MKNIIPKTIYVCLLIGILSGISFGASKPEPSLAVRVADAVLQRWPDPTAINRNGWEYNSGIVLVGIEKVYQRTKNPKYLKYIKQWVDAYIDNQGHVSFKKDDNNLDHLQPGLLLLFLYEETRQEKYKKATVTIRREFDNQPRNAVGGFWHKQRYPKEMWVDGIYMAEPFLVKYGYLFGDQEYCNQEATFQTILMASHAQDPKTGLLYHGWDQDKNAPWADPATGLSNVFWSRGNGWYAVALVEILEYLPKDHPQRQRLLEILSKVAVGLKQTQSPATGLWYQVLDRRDRKDNWPETSGSAMFVYALKTAVDKGYIDTSFMAVARKGWEGVQTRVKPGMFPEISGAVQGMGVQNSYQDYVDQKQLVNSTHGLCGVMLAGSAMEF